jgi:hypothetical protein
MIALCLMIVWDDGSLVCLDAFGYSGASHAQVGSYQASSRDVSIRASDTVASAETLEVAVGIE